MKYLFIIPLCWMTFAIFTLSHAKSKTPPLKKRITQKSTPKTITEGVLLKGNPADNALDAISDYDYGGHNSPTISGGKDSTDVISNQISVILKPTATVSQVNNALNSIGGKILVMSKGIDEFVVGIPPAKNIKELNDIIKKFSQSGVASDVDTTWPAELDDGD